MTDTYELPELPPSQMNVDVWDSEVRGLHQANAAYFTADQMRAYGQEYALLAVKAERERAGKLCEAIANGWISGKEFGMSGPEVAHMIAAAIRQGDKP